MQTSSQDAGPPGMPDHPVIMHGTAVIIPVHNRKPVTLKYLQLLRDTGTLGRATVIIIDDGSTDGTADAVTAGFPEVEILHGSGNLFWTGATEWGMRHAIARGASCCVWCNDDLVLHEDALEQVVALARERQAIVSGQGMIQLEGQAPWFFPGIYKGKAGLETRDLDVNSTVPIRVDTCRGNLVAIDKRVIERIGYPDGKNLPHIGGDTDYGLRATATGIDCLTLCSARFYEKETVRNDNRSWLLGKRSVAKIWSAAICMRGSLYPRMLWVYYVRHWGLRGVIRFVSGYLRLIAVSILRLTVPRKILHFCYASHSHAYQAYQGQPGESGND